MTNKYPKACRDCGDVVPAHAGNLSRSSGRWVVTHRHDCTSDDEAIDPVTAIEANQAAQERQADSAERAAGRADHSQWALARDLETGRF